MNQLSLLLMLLGRTKEANFKFKTRGKNVFTFVPEFRLQGEYLLNLTQVSMPMTKVKSPQDFKRLLPFLARICFRKNPFVTVIENYRIFSKAQPVALPFLFSCPEARTRLLERQSQYF